MNRELCVCVVLSDLTSSIISQQSTDFTSGQIIFTGTLRQSLIYADDNHLLLDIIFDYNAAYLYSKKLPDNLKAKDRKYWEMYHGKNLLMSNELVYTYRHSMCTIWLAAGDIKDMIVGFADVIHAISWKALILLQTLKMYDLRTGMYLYYESTLKQYICLGLADNQLITCRLFQPNRCTLLADILETSVYMRQFHHNDKYIVKIITNEQNQLLTEDCIENWIYLEYINMDMNDAMAVISETPAISSQSKISAKMPYFLQNCLDYLKILLDSALDLIAEYIPGIYKLLHVEPVQLNKTFITSDFTLKIDTQTQIPFIQASNQTIYIFLSILLCLCFTMFLQIKLNHINQKINNIHSLRMQGSQKLKQLFTTSEIPKYTKIAQIQETLNIKNHIKQHVFCILQILAKFKLLITSIHYTQNKSVIILKINKPNTYQHTIALTQQMQQMMQALSRSENVQIAHSIDGTLLKYTITIHHTNQ